MNNAIHGLTELEAASRRQQGLGNEVRAQTGRTYLQILRRNAFTFINSILFAISIILVLMGQMGDALVTAGLVLMNVLVGMVQEGRAKHKLEQIAILTRPTATVIRDGEEKELDPSRIVQGDNLIARPGDQIIADGQVVSGQAEMDESLLSGESERILKRPGDRVLSGSFCVSGATVYTAQQVGQDSVVNQLTVGARAFRQVKTPLQRDIDYIIRILAILATIVGSLLGISFLIQGLPLVEWVRVAAVIVALVPQGLFFMTTVAYALGAVRVAGMGALIQQTNAVESMSNVDLLCLDKTGTLTTNRIQFHECFALDATYGSALPPLEMILASMAASATAGSRTTAAIQQAFPGHALPVSDEVPFVSDQRWSALAFEGPELLGLYVLGAPEVLAGRLHSSADLSARIAAWTRQGLRVLLLAHFPGSTALHDDWGKPKLPSGLIPLALLSFRDELRHEALGAIHHFADLGIQLKIISGDDPRTVAALAHQVGFPIVGELVSGLDLEGKDESHLAQLAADSAIFGRIAPQQKELLVRLLRSSGHYVAMIGDGVNDILSLKQAHLGVAMQSGSQATRSVADMVLLGDSFAALPIAFREGQRIVKGMEDVVRLLLTRTFYVLLLVIATRLVGVPFPVTPKHNSVLALLTVGIPILAIAAWARPGRPPSSVVRATSHFVLPAAATISVVMLAIYLVYSTTTGSTVIARSALTTASVLAGLLLIPFVEPPSPWWVAGDELSGDRRPAALAASMLLLYGTILAVPVLRQFFELEPLRAIDYFLIGTAVALWAVAQRWIWRSRLFERLLRR